MGIRITSSWGEWSPRTERRLKRYAAVAIGCAIISAIVVLLIEADPLYLILGPTGFFAGSGLYALIEFLKSTKNDDVSRDMKHLYLSLLVYVEYFLGLAALAGIIGTLVMITGG